GGHLRFPNRGRRLRRLRHRFRTAPTHGRARVTHYDLAIIGTGSGNSILDERYDGKRVALLEEGTFGGTCLNVGCIPTKMYVYAAEVAHTVRTAAKYGVDA